MGEEGGGGDQAADDHEGVSLDLSIGGCYQSRKITAATAAAETSVQVLSVDDHQKEVSTAAGAGGTMTQTSFPKGVMMLEKQRMKREMHALRRFEAMRKREEKQMIKKAAAAASGITTLLKVCSTTPVLRRNPSFDDMRMSPVPVEDDLVNDQEDVGGGGGVYNYKRPLMDVDHEHDQEQLEGGDHHIDQQRKRIATSEQLCPYHPCFRPIPSNPNEGTPFLLRSGSYAYNSPMIWKAHSMRNVGGGGDDFQGANSSALARNIANMPQPVSQRSIKQLGGASTNPVSGRRLSSSSSSPSTGNINGTRSRLCGHSNPEHCRWNSSAPAILQSAATTVIKTDQAVATDQQNPPISSDAVTLVEGKQLPDDDDQNQKTGVERKNGIPLIPVTQPRIHMPCVITQGDGSKKIKGRLYKYTKTEVTIICMCHGTLFSPAGFVKHAGGKDVSEPLKQISVIYS